jgi:hypothetical protein
VEKNHQSNSKSQELKFTFGKGRVKDGIIERGLDRIGIKKNANNRNDCWRNI